MVDDDEDDREMFRDALQTVDPSVKYMEAADGMAALEMLALVQMQLPDFIFLDLNMPRKDGKQFLAEISKLPHLKGVPVVVYTTSKNCRDMDEVKRLGAVHFVTKPFIFDDICLAIRFVLVEGWKHAAVLGRATGPLQAASAYN